MEGKAPEEKTQEAVAGGEKQQPQSSAGLTSLKEEDGARWWPEYPGTHFIGSRG